MAMRRPKRPPCAAECVGEPVRGESAAVGGRAGMIISWVQQAAEQSPTVLGAHRTIQGYISPILKSIDRLFGAGGQHGASAAGDSIAIDDHLNGTPHGSQSHRLD